ncbi:MAG: SAM-dependent methyltransferase [Promethearchaeota archaeon]
MGKDKKWISERKRDEYYKKAKVNHFSSRAAYKIIEMNKKHAILPKDGWVLDLCCAPGSWMEGASKFYPKLRIIGIDLQKVMPKNNRLHFIKKNIFDDDIVDEIKKIIQSEPPFIKAVLSDCAPKFTGARSTDLFRQYELSMRALDLAESLLVPGGSCVIKSFQGLVEETRELEGRLKSMFGEVKRTKPLASRGRSPEFYYIGKGKKALKKVEKS